MPRATAARTTSIETAGVERRRRGRRRRGPRARSGTTARATTRSRRRVDHVADDAAQLACAADNGHARRHGSIVSAARDAPAPTGAGYARAHADVVPLPVDDPDAHAPAGRVLRDARCGLPRPHLHDRLPRPPRSSRPPACSSSSTTTARPSAAAASDASHDGPHASALRGQAPLPRAATRGRGGGAFCSKSSSGARSRLGRGGARARHAPTPRSRRAALPRAGFEAIEPYNDNPNATHWYAEAIGCTALRPVDVRADRVRSSTGRCARSLCDRASTGVPASV